MVTLALASQVEMPLIQCLWLGGVWVCDEELADSSQLWPKFKPMHFQSTTGLPSRLRNVSHLTNTNVASPCQASFEVLQKYLLL